MGFWRTVFGPASYEPPAAVNGVPPQFVVDTESIDPAVFGLESYATPTSPAPRIDRRSAIQVPAVKRARDIICPVLGGLPLDLIGPDRDAVRSSLFEQPEKSVPRSVTMTRLFEDLLFEEVAWWEVTEFAWHGYPAFVSRVAPRKIDAGRLKREGRVYVDGRYIRSDHLIRFQSPNDGLLRAGARAIRTLLQLDAAAAMHADGTPPLDYFTLADPDDPLDDDEIAEWLSEWRAYRRSNTTGFIPPELVYNAPKGGTARDLQLAEARQHAVLEVARISGVDPEDLGVSTTSRTYANREQRLLDLKTFTLGPYIDAVQDRLSMGDVTPRGYYARLRLDAFLRSDTKSRFEAYKLGLEVGALGEDEIRRLEDKPDLRPEQRPAIPTSAPPLALPPGASSVNAHALPASTFDFITPAHTFGGDEPALRLDAPGDSATFEVDPETRTIRGLLVPYGMPAKSKGLWWQFAKGTLTFGDPTRVKLWIQHDPERAVGYAFELDDRDDGLYGAFKVARGAAGDDALTLAEDKVLDGFSIGLRDGGTWKTRQIPDGRRVNFAVAMPLMETSLTPSPSFDDSRVQSVAASATQEGNPTMTETTVNPDETTDPSAAPDFANQPVTMEQLQALLANPQAIGIPAREASPDAATFEVTHEPAPYRFDGLPGAHDFSTDLIAYGRDRDGEAGQRVMEFLADAFGPRFDVSTDDVNEANPSRQRPDMYVDERVHKNPFYNALYKGAISDGTPFVFPKFNSATGLVADHVEGTEPTPGAFTTTGQTVTPSAVSGKVEITREVWDQGGNPQVSGLIWRKMVQHYFDAMETKAVAVLTASAGSITDIPLTAGAADDDLVNELEAALAGLNFVAGGNSFDFAGTQIDLYKKLAAAVDSTGRKLLPIINPTNANGRALPGLGMLDVAGTMFTPARSLAATGAVVANSWLVDTTSVHVWNSAPQRLEFNNAVALIELAVWGYVAAAISDLNGVRQITYDPVA